MPIIHQVAVLCQFLEEVDYGTAFKALQERNSYDAMDTYYTCIWDISILEYLVRILYTTQFAVCLEFILLNIISLSGLANI